MGNAFKLRVPKPEFIETQAYQAVAEALDRLRFGVIQITVHDGKMMQVDVTERRRFNDSPST
jgi:hypothetical protein